MPTPAAWQAAIQRNGFDVDLDVNFDPATHSGFLPARYRDRDAGFEFLLHDVVPGEMGSEERIAAADGYDQCVSLITHSDLAEAISATIGAGVLAELTGGLLWDDESGEGHPSQRAVEWARASEAETLRYL